MPNKENINKLITALRDGLEYEGEPVGFDMREWHCGTTACIGGHAAILMVKEMGGKFYYNNTTANWLGLSDKQAHELFFSSRNRHLYSPNYITNWNATALDVIPVLEHLRDHDEVNWELALDSMEARLA